MRVIRDDAGSETPEAAVAVVVLFTVVWAVAQVVLVLMADATLDAAATRGARSARAVNGTELAGEQAAVEKLNRAGMGLVLDGSADVDRNESSGVVRVEVRGSAQRIFPLVGLTRTSVRVVEIERFRPDVSS